MARDKGGRHGVNKKKGTNHRKNRNKSNNSKLQKRKRDDFFGANDTKRPKLAEALRPVEPINDDSSEDEQNPFQLLLSTFNGLEPVTEKAIESEDSEEESIENEPSRSAPSETEDIDVPSSENSDAEELQHINHSLVQSEHLADGEEIIEEEEEDEETEREDTEDSLDPFACHLRYDLDPALLDAVSKTPQLAEQQRVSWPVLGQLVFQLPVTAKPAKSATTVPTIRIEEEETYAVPGKIPDRIDRINWVKLFIKGQIHNNISKANFQNLKDIQETNCSPLTPLQKELFSIVNNYQDLYYPERTVKNGEEVRFVYCLHAVNHILKTRTKILHHNSKLSRKDEVPDEFRDQGLVRPKVVIVVPFRNSALRIIKMIISILLPDEKANVINKSRFLKEYTGNELTMPKKRPRPEDYEELFSGNTDDTFRIGLNITRKSLKLYADFYSSDIIVASPLGLRMLVGVDGETDRDFDFLASVEVLVLDQAEVFLMQNWDHLLHVLDHLHLQPRSTHGTDFARVRTWAVAGHARYYRQTLLFSALRLPELNSLFNKRCHNYAGKVCVANPIHSGAICQAVVQLPQVFHRVEVQSVSSSITDRFDFFVRKILPQFKESIMNHVLVFIPSYFDYVRLRNYFRREDLSFVQICEYSKEAKIARARDMFFHDSAHFLLYSERFHFFRRPLIKGIRHLVFYQPPTFPHFYSEMCNLMQEANQNPRSGNESNMTVTVLYSKYDGQQLSAIVGTERASRMVSSGKSVHMFVTGD